MNSLHEQSIEMPQMRSFAAKNSLIETTNEIPPMNTLVATNGPQQNQKLIVQQPHVQNVFLGQPMQPMMRVTPSIPIVPNALPISFAIQNQIQRQLQQLQHLTPILIQ